MRIAFIGDIVGRPGRKIIKDNLQTIRKKFEIDYVIANAENASHGFGLTIKNCDELLKCGIDIITGGNHSFDKKKEMIALLETKPVLRPDNYPLGLVGSGVKVVEINGEKLAVINLMGQFSMPTVENPFNWAKKLIQSLHEENVKNIFIDFHGEATSEKRVIFMMLKGQVSAICGTHTHVSTDDLQIENSTAYLTDIGLTGCRDNVIGMDSKVPILKATTGLGGHFQIPSSCKSILQMMVIDIDDGKAINAFKIKKLCNKQELIITDAITE
ncbi:TIGR00282 family metallophosphoesterase [Malaciobacter marinus]|uniref:Metallophosphoesterase (YmdB domain) n=1 Tax=Malaciobacter marinus TaxID=505249 RepID=A0A347TI96_9BACT|nr:TIGR00282 family metallophosphoesterase [Malaciobacter marinus]AXX86324.1 metallophosphoesterase (YmdB domain) [Malaciobacter marinus]PHO11535.1 TIGR00282 family metallophosphoesterase [Malaciobacter marinus]PHO15426.1 TIGR00282 family metallophosphoesterase [Malaciobacter marinus]